MKCLWTKSSVFKETTATSEHMKEINRLIPNIKIQIPLPFLQTFVLYQSRGDVIGGIKSFYLEYNRNPLHDDLRKAALKPYLTL